MGLEGVLVDLLVGKLVAGQKVMTAEDLKLAMMDELNYKLDYKLKEKFVPGME